MKLTIQKILLKYALRIVFMVVLGGAFFLLPDADRRMLAQIFLITSYLLVALLAYVHLSCPNRRFRRALWCAIRHNDFRLVRLFVKSRNIRVTVLGGLGAFLCGVGGIAQVYGDQIGDKPVLFYFGAPLTCIVLFWSFMDAKN